MITGMVVTGVTKMFHIHGLMVTLRDLLNGTASAVPAHHTKLGTVSMSSCDERLIFFNGGNFLRGVSSSTHK